MQTPIQSTPVAILVRVSTTKQETSRQLQELQAVADARGWQVAEVVEETVSGNAGLEDRPALKRLVQLAGAGIIKKLLVHEISRLSRRPSVALTFVEVLEGCGVSLYWHSQSVETLLPNGKRNPASAIMLAILSEMARAERETLRERIVSGMAEARRKGVQIGRPKGTRMDEAQLLHRHRKVARFLRDGMSVRNSARLAGVDKNTALKVRQALAAC
jgi:DNA invertase Pin-like site-specific DNA recombinase